MTDQNYSIIQITNFNYRFSFWVHLNESTLKWKYSLKATLKVLKEERTDLEEVCYC